MCAKRPPAITLQLWSSECAQDIERSLNLLPLLDRLPNGLECFSQVVGRDQCIWMLSSKPPPANIQSLPVQCDCFDILSLGPQCSSQVAGRGQGVWMLCSRHPPECIS